MGILSETKIAKSKTKSVQIFENLFPEKTFMSIDAKTPADYVNIYWSKYFECYGKQNNVSLNGSIFELIIYTLLYRNEVRPFYTQARVAFVPNVVYDTILYSRDIPVSLSIKTSLRERYKQSDLEAATLKYVHRRAVCYLLTLNSEEAKNVKAKKRKGELIGIDKIVDCTSDEINELIRDLKEFQFEVAQEIKIVEGNLIE